MARLPVSPSHRSLKSPRSARGFTLHEMLITLLVAGVLSSASAGVYAMLQENHKTVAANELVAHLNLARSEAIKRRAHVRICASKDQSTCVEPDADFAHWQYGWLIYADANDNGEPEPAEIIRVQPSLGSGFVIRTARSRNEITYQPMGTSAGSPATFAVCDARGPKYARYVTISNTGRARISRTTTSNVRCT
ncbi:MAG: GspH/FimT family pseudopilin [Sulfurifustaceae bacterium]